MPKKKYVKRPFPRKGVKLQETTQAVAIGSCNSCGAYFELFHLDFSAVKCLKCDNIIQCKTIKEQNHEIVN
tara:strand:- start:131 stop:343 length:213 start_codon:yes stop_codon:yes gene_type:complete